MSSPCLPELPARPAQIASAKRKAKASHPSNTASSSRRKLQPPLPAKPPNTRPSQPIKTGQGLRTRRNDTTHPGFGREVIFVTRSTGLGLLIGRCRSLVVDEGYTMLRLHAISAAIPQALLLLHALMDILPYPRGDKGMWYEIRTGSVECVDEVSRPPRESKSADEGMDMDGFGGVEADIGGLEEEEPDRTIRIKSSIRIDLHISPRPRKIDPAHPLQRVPGEPRRNRPSKRRRDTLLKRLKGGGEEDEEAMTNAQGLNGADEGLQVVAGGVMDDDEEEEEIEER